MNNLASSAVTEFRREWFLAAQPILDLPAVARRLVFDGEVVGVVGGVVDAVGGFVFPFFGGVVRLLGVGCFGGLGYGVSDDFVGGLGVVLRGGGHRGWWCCRYEGGFGGKLERCDREWARCTKAKVGSRNCE